MKVKIVFGPYIYLPLGLTRLQINHGSTVANRTTGKTAKMMMILLMEKEKELEVSLTTVGLVDGGGAVGVKRKS